MKNKLRKQIIDSHWTMTDVIRMAVASLLLLGMLAVGLAKMKGWL